MTWFKDGLNEEELKKEYRRLAKQYHPDVSKDPDAEEKFKEINNQFDEYFTNQRIREYSWVDTVKAKKQAQQVRATLLVWLLRDRENPGKFFTLVEKRYIGWWFWRELLALKAITTDDPEWSGFRGGLAYCSYGQPNGDGEVFLKKLPAKITPANEQEMYWYNKDHFGDTTYEYYRLLKTRFGNFWATSTNHGYIFYVKCELPEEFLRIGNIDGEEAKYAARSIETVFVNERWIKESEVLDYCSGIDFAFRLFQDCTYDEFCKYHDVDVIPQYANEVGVQEVKNDFYFIEDPVVAYYARKGIIRIFASKHNFRVRFGYFDRDAMRRHIHLLDIEGAEAAQDYLDKINPEFDDHAKTLAKRGRIKIDTGPKKSKYWYLGI